MTVALLRLTFVKISVFPSSSPRFPRQLCYYFLWPTLSAGFNRFYFSEIYFVIVEIPVKKLVHPPSLSLADSVVGFFFIFQTAPSTFCSLCLIYHRKADKLVTNLRVSINFISGYCDRIIYQTVIRQIVSVNGRSSWQIGVAATAALASIFPREYFFSRSDPGLQASGICENIVRNRSIEKQKQISFESFQESMLKNS